MWQLQADAFVADQTLRADEPLRDRAVRCKERSRDLLNAEPADGLEAQRHARVGRQRRMAAHEHHAQLVVFDRGFLRLVGVAGRELQLLRDVMGAIAERRVAPKHVERTVARDAEQPSARVVGHAQARPLLQRLDERVLNDLFDEFQVGGTKMRVNHATICPARLRNRWSTS